MNIHEKELCVKLVIYKEDIIPKNIRDTLAVSKGYISTITTQNYVDYRHLSITRASIEVARTDVQQVVNVGNGWS